MNSQIIEITSLLESPFGGLNLSNAICLLTVWLDQFEGFLSPSEGGKFLQIPRAFLRLMYRLSGAAIKVVLYIFEHTWGYQDYEKKRKLTLDEIMHGRKKADGTRIDDGTRLSRGATRAALGEAEAIGVITCDVDDRDRARITTYYGVHVRHIQEDGTEEEHQSTETGIRGTKNDPLEVKKCTSGVQKVDPSGSKNDPRSVDRYLRKIPIERNLREDVVSNNHNGTHPKKNIPVSDPPPTEASYQQGYGGASPSLLTPEGHRFYALYCAQKYTKRPTINEKSATTFNQLGESLKDFEQLGVKPDELLPKLNEEAKEHLPPNATNKVIWPGNLVHAVGPLLEKLQQASAKGQPSPGPAPNSLLDRGRVMREKYWPGAKGDAQ